MPRITLLPISVERNLKNKARARFYDKSIQTPKGLELLES